MAGKLIKKGQPVTQVNKPAPRPTAGAVPSLQKAVAAKVASRPTQETDARSAWRKLFGG